MKNASRFTAALALLGLLGCEAPPPTWEEPPLFQAYDPSVTCPSDQVGWDLSTGGGLEQLKTNAVGSLVKVRSATLTGCGLTDIDLRTQCDGQASCTVNVTCDDAAADVSYVCGTENSVYKARVKNQSGARTLTLACGMPITVTRAIYAPTAAKPADISLQLSARCSGKRRCSNGASGYALNSYGDPAPNVAKNVRVDYLCGNETTSRTIDVDDFNLDFYCPLPPPKAIRETILIRSAKPWLTFSSPVLQGSNNAYGLELQAQFEKACTNKNECEVTFTGKRADGTAPQYWNAGNPNAGWNDSVQEVLGWPNIYRVPPGPWTNIGGNYLVVSYTCGAGSFVEKRVFDPQAAAPNNTVRLKCGDPVTITGVDSKQADGGFAADPVLTGIMKTRCNGVRACTPPAYIGPPGPGRYAFDGGTVPLGPGQTYKYTCGDDTTTVRTATVDNKASVNLALIECPPPPMDVKVPGIRLVSVDPPERTLEVSRSCTGQDVCTVPTGVTALYTCVDSPSVKSSAELSGKLACGQTITLLSVSPSCWSMLPSDWCGSQPGSCTFGTGPAQIGTACPGNPTFTFTCGCDPTVRSTTITGVRNVVTATCPALSDATACKRKSCVPKYCYGAKKRDSNMQCVDDSTLVPTQFFATPTVIAWQPSSDGGTNLTPPTQSSSTTRTALLLKSDYPYQPFTFISPVTEGSRTIDRKAHVLQWAYDEFSPKAGAKSLDGGTLPPAVAGFRCVVSETGLENAPTWGTTGGTWVAGGTGQTFHPRCFDQDRPNDPSSSITDAAFRTGYTEGQFRDRFQRSASYITVSLDPHGVATVPSRRYYANGDVGVTTRAVNPIGFFYDPKRDYVSLYDYYAQTNGESNVFEVNWQTSTQIELAVMSGNISYGDLLLDVETPELLPEFDVDMAWFLRGDSPANPYSPRSRVANNPAGTSLAARNLRMTVEMARKDGSTTSWEASNSVRFAAKPLSGGNNFIQTDRAHVVITPEVQKRLMSIRKTATTVSPAARPDGFMANSLDPDTSFLVRACIDFDGAERAIDAPIAAATLPDLSGYSVKVSTRCTEPRTIVIRRQLFVRPVLPAEQTEAPGDRGAVQPQGDKDVGGPQSNGVELGCIRQCTVNADCGEAGMCTPGTNGTFGTCVKTPDNMRCRDATVAQGGMGGQFPLSLYEVRTEAKIERSTVQRAATNTTNTCTTSRGALLTFTVSDPPAECTAAADGPVKSKFQTSFSPNIQGIIDLVKAIRSRTAPGSVMPDAKKATNVRKGFGGAVKAWSSKRKKGLQEPAEGVAVGISKEFFVTIGPVPISIEISATAGFGFKFELEKETEQAKPGMTTEFYPCVNATNTTCYSFEDSPLSTFDEALTACNQKGGTLALVTTGSMNTAFNTAMSGKTGAYWMGALSQYNYDYPPCADGGVFIDGGTGPNGTFSQGCKDYSATGYQWTRGGGIASQLGTAPAIIAGSNKNNSFANFQLPGSFVPDKAALTVTPDSNKAIGADRVTAKHKYACSYDSASEVYSSKFEKKFSIEFGIGVGAAICLPSSRIGVCAVLDFKIFEATWSFGSSNQETNVYRGVDSARYRQSVFGEKLNFGVWERKALEGSFSIELRFFFVSENFKVKEFGLLKGEPNYPWNGDIFPPASTPYFTRKAGE